MLGDVQSAWRCAECLEMCKVLASVQSACRCAMCLKMCNVLEYVQTWRERVSSGCSHVVLVGVGFDRGYLGYTTPPYDYCSGVVLAKQAILTCLVTLRNTRITKGRSVHALVHVERQCNNSNNSAHLPCMVVVQDALHEHSADKTLSLSLSVSASVSLCPRLSVSLCVSASVSLGLSLPLSFSVSLCLCLSLSVCLCLSLCPCVSVSVCLSVCLSVS